MISYLISDNTDTLVGMRLAGITGVVLKTREEALEEFNDCLNNKEIGILILILIHLLATKILKAILILSKNSIRIKVMSNKKTNEK